jgi:hypothetical protein
MNLWGTFHIPTKIFSPQGIFATCGFSSLHQKSICNRPYGSGRSWTRPHKKIVIGLWTVSLHCPPCPATYEGLSTAICESCQPGPAATAIPYQIPLATVQHRNSDFLPSFLPSSLPFVVKYAYRKIYHFSHFEVHNSVTFSTFNVAGPLPLVQDTFINPTN